MKILIVDDEPLVREGLQSTLHSLRGEYDIWDIREACNGREAIDILHDYTPDIIFTDIKMPRVNGIDLIKWVEQNGGTSTMIALSCFDDYSYVREAFKYGALDYVLKYDIDRKSIKKLLDTALESSFSTGETSRSAVPSGAAASLFPDENVFLNTFEQRIDNEVREKSGMLIILLLDQYSSGKESLILKSAETKGQEILEGQSGIISFILQHTWLCIYLESPCTQLDASSFFTKISGYILQKYGRKISVGVSEIVKGTEAGKKLFQQVRSILNHSFYEGPGRVIFYSDIEVVFSNIHGQDTIEEWKKRIFEQIFEECLPVLRKTIHDIEAELERNRNYSGQVIKNLYIEVLRLMRLFSTGLCSNIGPDRWTEWENNIYGAYYFSVLSAIFRQILSECYPERSTILRNSDLSVGIRRAVDYIRTNYGSPNISLREVADYLKYSSSYLSRQFKKETGLNIVTYINSLRLEEARRLLQTKEYLVYEIAQIVGYNNYNYFSKLYKIKYGVSPSSEEHEHFCSD